MRSEDASLLVLTKADISMGELPLRVLVFVWNESPCCMKVKCVLYVTGDLRVPFVRTNLL